MGVWILTLNASSLLAALDTLPRGWHSPQTTAGGYSSLVGQPEERNFKTSPCRKGSSITSLFPTWCILHLTGMYFRLAKAFLPWLLRCVKGCNSWCLLTQNQSSRREHYFPNTSSPLIWAKPNHNILSDFLPDSAPPTHASLQFNFPVISIGCQVIQQS